MKKIFILLTLLFVTGFSCKSPSSSEDGKPEESVIPPPQAIPKTNSQSIFVHYMPWFQSKEISGSWGWHWTMNNQNPDITDATGKRQIASYFYPLIGPYDSSDPDVLEYHVLLMKLSGMDGVVIDWYGVSGINDYGKLKTNSDKFIETAKKAGLKFIICYEDRTIQTQIDKGKITASGAIQAAQSDFKYMDDTYFSNEYYFKLSDKPLVLNFGPIYFKNSQDWKTISSICSNIPQVFPLFYKNSKLPDNSYAYPGEFTWVDPLSKVDLYYYNNNSKYKLLGVALPGYKDFYLAGGLATGNFNSVAYNNGSTFKNFLSLTQTYSLDFIQIATWNDFGEGTNIEPALDADPFKYIKALRKFTGASSVDDDFALVKKLYDLRKSKKEDGEIQSKLNSAFYLFSSNQLDSARSVINRL